VNREHAIFEAKRCVAVNPSDTAPALIALDAKLVIHGPGGERVVDAEDYFITPATDIRRMTILEPSDLLTAIRIPGTWAGSKSHFEKVRDRQAWDFALVNVASAMKLSGTTIEDIRIVVNAAGELAVLGARPLQHNAYKIPLMRNLVRRAIRTT
jgi:xanthine dehydrogenase YagS FAD-binding subunit